MAQRISNSLNETSYQGPPTLWHQWTAGGPFRLLGSISRANDTKLGSNGKIQVIDSARLVCDDERLSRKWRRRPCLIRSSKTRSSHGWKYVVEGEIETPAGRSVVIRTVWIVDHGQSSPRLVTAYPLVPEKDDD